MIVLFGGGTKKGQRSDIRRAQLLFEEYESRKAALKDGPSAKR